jgi:hypothetical protein
MNVFFLVVSKTNYISNSKQTDLMRISSLLKSAAALSCMLITANSNAQMVGGSVFLKGNYVEAGICANGDFGAATPPAGYHPHTISTGGGALGFVADPAMDGWTVGTPAYMGDYFTPGSPFEGWNLQIGSIRAQAHSCGGFTGTGLTGANVSYAVSGSKVIGTWEGSFDSMTVRQVTTLDTLALFFSMRITLINMASVPKNNIYYMRSVDPDNNQSWPGGGFPTNNTITYQLPNALNATVVTATSFSGPASSLSLGTTDTNAKCLIYPAWPIASGTDLATVYGGTYSGTYAAGATYNGDVAIGLVFKVAHLAPVDSASDSVGYKTTATHLHPANEKSFTYFYAFSTDGLDSAIAEQWKDTASTPIVPPPPPSTVKSINNTSLVNVYPNPTRGLLNITGLVATDKIAVYDLMGRDVSQSWTISDREVNTFSTQDIPAGNYIVVVKDQRGRLKANVPLRKQ